MGWKPRPWTNLRANLMSERRRERDMLRRFTIALRDLWQSSGEAGGVYRPDRHYMRGPGPKWHAKYGHLYPKSGPMNAQANAALGEIAKHHA